MLVQIVFFKAQTDAKKVKFSSGGWTFSVFENYIFGVSCQS